MAKAKTIEDVYNKLIKNNGTKDKLGAKEKE